MDYACTDARFLFWNNKLQFTVEYCYSLSMWFVFRNEEKSDCIFKKSQPLKWEKVNMIYAEEVLEQYLTSTLNQ